MADTDRWVSIVGDGTVPKKTRNDGSIKYRYQPTVIHRYFDEYVKAFPDAVTRKNADGGIEARLSTFAELSARFNAPEEFLLLPNVEATRSVDYANGRRNQLHMNYVNIPQLLPSYLEKGFNRREKDIPLASFLAAHAQEVAAVAKARATPHLFILNHPIWTWYDVGPEVVVENPLLRFFEVCIRSFASLRSATTVHRSRQARGCRRMALIPTASGTWRTPSGCGGGCRSFTGSAPMTPIATAASRATC